MPKSRTCLPKPYCMKLSTIFTLCVRKAVILATSLCVAVAVATSCGSGGNGGGSTKNTGGGKDECGKVAKHLKLGDDCYRKGDYTDALEHYVKGLKKGEASGCGDSLAVFYKNIGNIYCLFEDYERGETYYRQGLEYCRKYGDRQTEAKILINLTGISTFMNDAGKARAYYRQLERLGLKDDGVTGFMTKFNLGLLQLSEKRYRAAADNYLDLAAKAAAKGLPPIYLCSAYQQAYKAYLGMGWTDSAFYYMKKCERTAEDNNIQYRHTELFKDLSSYYNDKGNVHASQQYKARYLALKDSVYNMREFDAAKHAQFLYEMDKIDREIKGLKTQSEEYRRTVARQRAILAGIITVVLTVCVFLVIIYRQKRKLHISYGHLYSVNRKYVERLEEMQRRTSAYKERINAQADEIKRLNEALGQQAERTGKYSSSGLADDTRLSLADAIMNAMENRKEFCNSDFSLAKLAETVGSNSKYVSQVINDTFGKNFSNYVNEYRVNLACMRLADFESYGNYTISAIAESVGFKSYSTFNNVFTKITGITPSMYQKMALQERGTA